VRAAAQALIPQQRRRLFAQCSTRAVALAPHADRLTYFLNLVYHQWRVLSHVSIHGSPTHHPVGPNTVKQPVAANATLPCVIGPATSCNVPRGAAPCNQRRLKTCIYRALPAEPFTAARIAGGVPSVQAPVRSKPCLRSWASARQGNPFFEPQRSRCHRRPVLPGPFSWYCCFVVAAIQYCGVAAKREAPCHANRSGSWRAGGEAAGHGRAPAARLRVHAAARRKPRPRPVLLAPFPNTPFDRLAPSKRWVSGET
jgi:hypothetical protein